VIINTSVFHRGPLVPRRVVFVSSLHIFSVFLRLFILFLYIFIF